MTDARVNRTDQGASDSSALDAERFAARFREEYRRLWTVAAAVAGDRVLADDIVQDAAVIALGKLDQFQPGTNFFAWMAKIVRFSALNDVRKRRNRGLQVVEPAALDRTSDVEPARQHKAPADATVDAADFEADFDDDVMHGLEALEPAARACLLLRTIHQLTYAEISAALEMPEGTAMSHVHRSKKALRDHLRTRSTDNRRERGGGRPL